MKHRYLVGLALLAGMVGAQSDKFIDAARFVVFKGDGKPSVVMMNDASGAGRFIVYDAEGDEAFAVKGGNVSGEAFEERVRQIAVAAQPAVPPPPQAQSRRTIDVKQPEMLGTAKLMRAEVVDEVARPVVEHQPTWGVKHTYCIRTTNTSKFPFSADLEITSTDPARVAVDATSHERVSKDGPRVLPGEATLWCLSLTASEGVTNPLQFITIELAAVHGP